MTEDFLIVVTGNDDGPTLHFEGTIDKNTEIYHPIIVPTPPPSIIIDLKKLTNISDSGLKVWMDWIYNIFKTTSITIKNVPCFFIEKHNSISHFIPTGSRVTSFQLKYYCSSCKTSDMFLMKNGTDYNLKSKTPHFKNKQCTKCNKESIPLINRARELSFLIGNEQNRYSIFNTVKTSGIVVFDINRKIIFANESFSTLMNISNKRLINNNLYIYDTLHTDVPELFCSKDGTEGKDSPVGPVPITIMNKNEDISNLLLSLSKDEYAENRWIVSLENSSLNLLVKDKISLQNKNSNNETAEKIKQILKNPSLLSPVKEIDQQTGTLTLNSFLRSLRNEILYSKENEKNLSLVTLQIDFFDKIIEKYGEELGDTIVKRVAHSLASFTRGTDIVARTGKCKFSIVMLSTNLLGLNAAMNKIKRILNKQIPRNPSEDNSPTITITSSLGGLYISSTIAKHIEPNYLAITSIIEITNDNLESAIISGGNRIIATEMGLDD